MQRTKVVRRYIGYANRTWFPLHPHKFHELSSWQKSAMGLHAYERKLAGRPPKTKLRFHAESVHVTKGTSDVAWKWEYQHQSHLANLRPAGQQPPIRCGRDAWPASWDEDFAAGILSLDEEGLRESVMQHLTKALQEETQKDGYELRRLDFEGKPITEYPERKVVEMFVLEEETMRERIIQRIVEGIFRIVPTSEERRHLKVYRNIADFIVDKVETCRVSRDLNVSDHVKEVLQAHPDQPKLGYAQGLPGSRWGAGNDLVDEWERLYRHDWQFGHAVYTPRSVENTKGNLQWLRLQEEERDRVNFRQYVADGRAKEEALRRISAAAVMDEQ